MPPALLVVRTPQSQVPLLRHDIAPTAAESVTRVKQMAKNSPAKINRMLGFPRYPANRLKRIVDSNKDTVDFPSRAVRIRILFESQRGNLAG